MCNSIILLLILFGTKHLQLGLFTHITYSYYFSKLHYVGIKRFFHNKVDLNWQQLRKTSDNFHCEVNSLLSCDLCSDMSLASSGMLGCRWPQLLKTVQFYGTEPQPPPKLFVVVLNHTYYVAKTQTVIRELYVAKSNIGSYSLDRILGRWKQEIFVRNCHHSVYQVSSVHRFTSCGCVNAKRARP